MANGEDDDDEMAAIEGGCTGASPVSNGLRGSCAVTAIDGIISSSQLSVPKQQWGSAASYSKHNRYTTRNMNAVF